MPQRSQTPARRKAAPPAKHDGPYSRVHDAELRREFVGLIRAGMFKVSAAARIGVPVRTVNSWLARGMASVQADCDARDALDAGQDVPLPAPDEPYHAFWLAYADADAEAEAQALGSLKGLIRAGGTGSGDLLKFYLGRRWADRWATGNNITTRVQVGEGGTTVTVGPERVDLWTEEERVAAVLAALSEAGVAYGRRFVEAGMVIDAESREALPAADT